MEVYSELATSISNVEAPKMSIYSYPATNNLTIELSGIQDKDKLQILNISGQMVKELNLAEQRQQINIANLQSGVYFVCTKSNVQITQKFIKQ